MNKIEELIQQYCPNGVEYKDLGEVCKFQRGTSITFKDVTEGEIPVIAGGQKPSYYHNTPNRTGETIAVSGSGAYAGFVSYWTIPVFLSDSFSVNPDKDLLLPKYVFYYLKHNQEKIHDTKKGGGVPHVHGSSIAKFQIPIPPLPIQQEIVKILDIFTQLEAELEAELEARRAQYEYYRNRLLSATELNGKWLMNGVEVQWKTLGEVCKFVRGPFGGAIKKDCFVPSGYAIYEQQHAIYGNTDIRYFISDEKFKELKRFEVLPGDLIMSCSGTMGKIAIIPVNAPKGVINQALLKLSVKNEIGSKYLKYYFEDTITQQMNDDARGGAIKNVASVDVLKKIQIPIPPIAEQERITGILDKFDSLVNDISIGLPAEIDGRRKQYNYYRGKLLTFKQS